MMIETETCDVVWEIDTSEKDQNKSWILYTRIIKMNEVEDPP